MVQCSLWVASTAAGLHGWHAMGVPVHASAHSLKPLPALLPSSPPQNAKGGQGRGRKGKVGVNWRGSGRGAGEGALEGRQTRWAGVCREQNLGVAHDGASSAAQAAGCGVCAAYPTCSTASSASPALLSSSLPPPSADASGAEALRWCSSSAARLRRACSFTHAACALLSAPSPPVLCCCWERMRGVIMAVPRHGEVAMDSRACVAMHERGQRAGGLHARELSHACTPVIEGATPVGGGVSRVQSRRCMHVCCRTLACDACGALRRPLLRVGGRQSAPTWRALAGVTDKPDGSEP